MGSDEPFKPNFHFLHQRGEKKKQKEVVKEKRTRKSAPKAARSELQEDEEDEEEQRKKSSEKKPKKKAVKQSVKMALGAWNGEEFPRIAKVVKCKEEGLDFRMDVYVKKPGERALGGDFLLA